MKKVLEFFGYEKACIPLKKLEKKHAAKYAHFRELLNHNHHALSLMAKMEEIYYGGKPFTIQAIRRKSDSLLVSIKAIISALQQISGTDFPALIGLRNTIERNLQFSGGAGSLYGRVLRVQFLGIVLQKLGFEIALTGDFLEASLSRHDRSSTEEKLDQMGRLLACSHMLDMAVRTQEDVDRLVDSFFRGKYNLLARKAEGEPEAFYIHGGHWRVAEEEGRSSCIQDGSQWGLWLGAGIASVMVKMMGSKYQDFPDNIGAYYYFPLAIAKESWIESGRAEVKIKPIDGHIDQAGGLAFGIRDINNYFVFRINALENNVILFEFVRSKRIQRVSVEKPIDSKRWYNLSAQLKGNEILGILDGEVLIRYTAERPVDGYEGLWTKADSVTAFDGLATATDEVRSTYTF